MLTCWKRLGGIMFEIFHGSYFKQTRKMIYVKPSKSFSVKGDIFLEIGNIHTIRSKSSWSWIEKYKGICCCNCREIITSLHNLSDIRPQFFYNHIKVYRKTNSVLTLQWTIFVYRLQNLLQIQWNPDNAYINYL